MKYFKKAILFFILIISVNTYAINKEDIISLTENINICSDKTNSLLKGFKNSYIRMLNERNISEEDLTTIYNNINKVINILNSNEVCSTEDKDKIPDNVKSTLYNLYNQTNNIILKSPKITAENENKENVENEENKVNKENEETKTTIKEDTNIVIDKNNDEIKIYDNGTLKDIIKINNKLNYVGINKIVKILIVGLSVTLIALIILKIIRRKSLLVTSLIYCNIFLLIIIFGFKDKISIGLDVISLMNVQEKITSKQAIISNNKIISYPSYGTNYGTIKISDQVESIYFGDSANILKQGIGTSSMYAIPGDNKKVVLSGHNTGVFRNLSKLKIGNKINIHTNYANFDYKVKATKIVSENDSSSLEKDYDLILYTCYPNDDLYGSKRLIVYANLTKSKWLGESK